MDNATALITHPAAIVLILLSLGVAAMDWIVMRGKRNVD